LPITAITTITSSALVVTLSWRLEDVHVIVRGWIVRIFREESIWGLSGENFRGIFWGNVLGYGLLVPGNCLDSVNTHTAGFQSVIYELSAKWANKPILIYSDGHQLLKK